MDYIVGHIFKRDNPLKTSCKTYVHDSLAKASELLENRVDMFLYSSSRSSNDHEL